MRRYKFFCLTLLLFFVFLAGWYVFVQGGWTPELLQQKYMGQYLGGGAGYNWIFLHRSLYLAAELSLWLLVFPKINTQYLTRMTRSLFLRQVWKTGIISAAGFCMVFCTVQLLMTRYFVSLEVLGGGVFYLIWMIFFVRLLLLYLIFNSIFLLLYSFSGRVEVAFFLGVFLPMMGLFLDFGVFDLTNCMEIYEDFYGERGMDLLQCVLDTFKQLFCIIILHWTSLIVFEKRDILDEKG